jgi:transcriptional regulator with XRE-family HTH domain
MADRPGSPTRPGSAARRAVAEARRVLAAAVRRRRQAQGLTQVRLAALLGSSQSRVAKLEAADLTVSLELLMRALVVLGATREEVGRAMAEQRPAEALAARRRRGRRGKRGI